LLRFFAGLDGLDLRYRVDDELSNLRASKSAMADPLNRVA